jgi:carbon storage regulator
LLQFNASTDMLAPDAGNGQNDPTVVPCGIPISQAHTSTTRQEVSPANPGGKTMLVLSRKVGEAIQIGDNIEVMVVRIGPGVVRIGVAAPKEMSIFRQEIDPKLAADNHEEASNQFEETDWLKSR